MTTRPARRRWRLFPALGVAVAVLVSGCDFDGAYDLPLPGSIVDEDKSYEVTAEFDDVLNVVPRSPIMVDDVPVGEVTEVERTGWNAVLTMRIREDVDLPDNATAAIRQTSLLGEKYVALEEPPKPSADRLGDGDRIGLAATGRNPEVEEVLGALSFLLSGGGVGQLATITHELNLVMTGRTERLQNLLGTLDGVVATVDAQKADIIRAMTSMNRLAKTLNRGSDTIDEALDAMAPAIAVLSDQHAELMKMLRALDRLGEVGARVIRASKDDLLATLRDLRPVLDRLNEAGVSLPRGLSLMLSFPFPEAAQEIVRGDYANTEIVFDINFENFIRRSPVPVPEPGEVLTDLQQCLRSGSLTSPACAGFLTNLSLFNQLESACAGNTANPVCRAVNSAPGGQGSPIPVLPDLGGLSGLLTPTRTATSTDLYGGAL
jgi:phospholipid/cholesterol/gamma-HCH transport system substrate-binding protein